MKTTNHTITIPVTNIGTIDLVTENINNEDVYFIEVNGVKVTSPTDNLRIAKRQQLSILKQIQHKRIIKRIFY
jgi:hypothetical protein